MNIKNTKAFEIMFLLLPIVLILIAAGSLLWEEITNITWQTFRGQFWPQFVATIIGVGLGIPAGFYLEHLIENRTEKEIKRKIIDVLTTELILNEDVLQFWQRSEHRILDTIRLAVLAVIGTLAGVGVGGIIGYEGHKRIQKRQRELDLDEQQRQHKRIKLNELSNEFNSLAISTHEFHLHKILDLKYSEQERKGFVLEGSKVFVKLQSFPHKDLLILLYSKYPNILDDEHDLDFEDLNQKLQPIIQELIYDTYDPNFSMKTVLSAESLGIDPDEYQKAVENLP